MTLISIHVIQLIITYGTYIHNVTRKNTRNLILHVPNKYKHDKIPITLVGWIIIIKINILVHLCVVHHK